MTFTGTPCSRPATRFLHIDRCLRHVHQLTRLDVNIWPMAVTVPIDSDDLFRSFSIGNDRFPACVSNSTTCISLKNKRDLTS